MAQFKEKILFSRLKQKDKEAFAKAYDLYLDQIHRFIYFKVGNREVAEDLTSAVFLKTWNYIQDGDLEKHKTIKPLVYKIARTTIIDHYRKKNQENSLAVDSQEAFFDIVDKGQDILKQAKISSDISMVTERLLELKDEYREIIIMRYIDELTIKEIAKVLDKSRGNIRVLTFRALKALKELVNQDE